MGERLTVAGIVAEQQALTVACVYRSGSRLYTTSYVEILQDMVRRHLSRPYEFVCLSDDERVPCRRIPLIAGWPGYFSKIELFRQGLFHGPVLYFDLDTIIHGSLDALADLACKIPFGCVSDPLGGHMNSSVLMFNVDCSVVFERFDATGFFERRLQRHAWWLLRRVGLERRVSMGSSYGDQGFTEMCLTDAGIPITHVDRLLPELFSTFNYSASRDREPPGSICMMMGRPKPHEIATGWVPRSWRLSGANGAQV